jgi:hypothetical protein
MWFVPLPSPRKNMIKAIEYSDNYKKTRMEYAGDSPGAVVAHQVERRKAMRKRPGMICGFICLCCKTCLIAKLSRLKRTSTFNVEVEFWKIRRY